MLLFKEVIFCRCVDNSCYCFFLLQNEVIKKQLTDQSKTIEQLKADNAKLEKENERLMETFRAMEAQIKDLSSKKGKTLHLNLNKNKYG